MAGNLAVRIGRKIWPKHRAPLIRSKILSVYFLLFRVLGPNQLERKTRKLRYLVWSYYSRLLFGETRRISVYGNKKLLVRTNDWRAFRIAEMRGSQKEKIAVWKKVALLLPTVCVDIGANYGEFSVAVADCGSRVIAIEANPAIVSCLNTTFAGFNNVTVIQAAASEVDETVLFFFNRRASGSGSLGEQVPEGERSSLGGLGRVENVNVPSRKLDTLIPEIIGGFPETLLLKMDVEGFEESVMRGARTLLERALWWRALIEFNPGAIRRGGGNPERFWNMLRKSPGVIVAGLRCSGTTRFDLDMVLPVAPPSSDIDVLVGQGITPDIGQA